MERRCELCADRATVYCPADDANVCWSCDAKVHSANFLVARHSRSVLCSKCCEPTDCRTSGSHPSPLCRLCGRCNPSTVTRAAAVEDCNGDSDEKEKSESLSHPSAAAEDSGCTCASEESHTRPRSGQDRRKQAVESMMVMGRAPRGLRVTAGESRRSGLQERASGKKVQGRRIKKRSSSPVSVIPVDAVSLRLYKRNVRRPVVTLVGNKEQTGLRIQSLQLDTSRNHRAEEPLEESGEGSNSVSPANKQRCSSPFCFQLLEREPDDSSCVSCVDGEGKAI